MLAYRLSYSLYLGVDSDICSYRCSRGDSSSHESESIYYTYLWYQHYFVYLKDRLVLNSCLVVMKNLPAVLLLANQVRETVLLFLYMYCFAGLRSPTP